jgi:GAF domain-containing protein
VSDLRVSETPLADNIQDIALETLNEVLLTLKLERAVVLIHEPDGWKVACSHEIPTEKFWVAAPISQTILRSSILKKEPVFLVDAMNAPEYSSQASVVISGMRSVASVPVLDHYGEVMAVVYADHLVQRGAFGPAELETLKELAKEFGKKLVREREAL